MRVCLVRRLPSFSIKVSILPFHTSISAKYVINTYNSFISSLEICWTFFLLFYSQPHFLLQVCIWCMYFSFRFNFMSIGMVRTNKWMNAKRFLSLKIRFQEHLGPQFQHNNRFKRVKNISSPFSGFIMWIANVTIWFRLLSISHLLLWSCFVCGCLV